MSNKRVTFRIPSMDSRVKRAERFSEQYGAPNIAYEAWHKGYQAAVRDIRKALRTAAARSTLTRALGEG